MGSRAPASEELLKIKAALEEQIFELQQENEQLHRDLDAMRRMMQRRMDAHEECQAKLELVREACDRAVQLRVRPDGPLLVGLVTTFELEAILAGLQL